MEKSQRQTLDSLVGENDKILSQDLRQRIQIESEKLDQIFKSSIQQHKRQHEETCQMVKTQLQTDRQALESQLSQQSELKTVLEKVQKRTVEISEVVS